MNKKSLWKISLFWSLVAALLVVGVTFAKVHFRMRCMKNELRAMARLENSVNELALQQIEFSAAALARARNVRSGKAGAIPSVEGAVRATGPALRREYGEEIESACASLIRAAHILVSAPGFGNAPAGVRAAETAGVLQEPGQNVVPAGVSATADVAAGWLAAAIYHSTLFLALLLPIPCVWLAFCVHHLHRRVLELEARAVPSSGNA